MTENFAYTHDDSTPGELITGQRTSWSDTTWNIAPDDTMLLMSIGRDSNYKETEHKWLVENLPSEGAADANAKAQGSASSPSTENRYECKNYNMILSTSAFISRTQEKQGKYGGVNSELNHQMVNKMIALRQSVELAVACRVRKRNPQTSTKAGLMQGIPGLVGLYGDQIKHVNGSSVTYGASNTVNIEEGEPSFDQASTATGQDTFRTVLKDIAKLGSKPTLCFCSYDNKEYISTTWDLTNVDRQMMEKGKLKEVVDVYMTDFGIVRFIPTLRLKASTSQATSTHAFDGAGALIMQQDFALLIDPRYVTLKLFDDFFTEDLNLDEDGVRRRGMVEFNLEVSAPQGLGVFNFGADSSLTPQQIALPTTAAGYVQS